MSLAVVSDQRADVRPAPSSRPSEELLDRFNQAVRWPARFGGVSMLPLLLDQLAAAEGQTEGTVWVADAHQRLSIAKAFQSFFADPEIHVMASQYGEDAFRRGWLRLDRALEREELDRLLDGVLPWSKSPRTLHDVITEYGPASITFGDPDPRRPKTLGYATCDREAPFVVFHLDAADSIASQLAVRTHYDFAFTPRGKKQASGSVGR